MADQTKTQSEWYTATNPDVLLAAARPLEKVTSKREPARLHRREVFERRARLFSCACVRMVWDFLPTDARNAVMISERFAYGNATGADLNAAAVRASLPPITFQQHAINAADHASQAVSHWDYGQILAARSVAKALATRAAGRAPLSGSPIAVEWQSTWNTVYHAARAQQAELVRDIFPPPDHAARALRLEREWLTPTVMTLARQADENGEYSALPILADALQDAGCDNEFILDRCRASLRQSGESAYQSNTRLYTELHSRGNWVVDLLLGRE